MSWIFGLAGKIADQDISKATGIAPDALIEETSDNLYITSGGIKETCFYSKERRLLVCGIGISSVDNIPNNNTPKILDFADWLNIHKHPELAGGINGHFVKVSWDRGGVRFSNDIFGLRDIYFYSIRDHIVFSTRLDWIAEYVGGLEIDYNELSSQWLLNNKMSFGSIAKGVRRLAAGGQAFYENGKITISRKQYTPAIDGNETRDTLYETVSRLIHASESTGRDIAISLSGGIDSRFLLAVMIGSGVKFDAVTFGPMDHPDSEIAGRICKSLGIMHSQLDSDYPAAGECYRRAMHYVGQNMLLTKGSDFLHFNYYEYLHNENKIIIDAGRGEIVRRGSLNKLLLRGPGKIINNDPDGAMKYFRGKKPNLFRKEVFDEMQINAVAHLTDLFNSLPPVEEFGIENWLDLMMTRSLMPNNISIEQSRVDGLAMCYTPFAQPDLINLIFNLPLVDKKNAAAIKKFISDKAPGLSGFPLVKGTTKYPYSLPTLPAKVYTVLKSKALPGNKSGYPDSKAYSYLSIMKEPILDSISSASFRNYDYYGHERIRTISDEYYKGNKKYASELDWWFTFDMFRKSLSLED